MSVCNDPSTRGLRVQCVWILYYSLNPSPSNPSPPLPSPHLPSVSSWFHSFVLPSSAFLFFYPLLHSLSSLPPPHIPPLPFHSRFILSIYPQAPSSSSLPFSHSHIIFSSFFMVFSFTLDKSTLFSRLLCLELLISAANELKGNCKPRYCFQTWRFNAQLGSRRSWFSGAVSAYLL